MQLSLTVGIYCTLSVKLRETWRDLTVIRCGTTCHPTIPVGSLSQKEMTRAWRGCAGQWRTLEGIAPRNSSHCRQRASPGAHLKSSILKKAGRMGSKQEKLETCASLQGYGPYWHPEKWWDDSCVWRAGMEGQRHFMKERHGRWMVSPSLSTSWSAWSLAGHGWGADWVRIKGRAGTAVIISGELLQTTWPERLSQWGPLQTGRSSLMFASPDPHEGLQPP